MFSLKNSLVQEILNLAKVAQEAKKSAFSGGASNARATDKTAVAPTQKSAASDPTPTAGATPTAATQDAKIDGSGTQPTKAAGYANVFRLDMFDPLNNFDCSGMQVFPEGGRTGYVEFFDDTYSPLPTERIIRPRQVCCLGDGGPSSLVVPVRIAFEESVLSNADSLMLCPEKISYVESLRSVHPDLLIADERALPSREDQKRLSDHLRGSSRVPIVICDPESEFAKSLPGALRRPFPKTHGEVNDRLFEVFFGPPPVSRLMSYFRPVLDQLPDEIFPMEFVDHLEYLYPEAYADALRFLKECSNPRRILRGKVLDMLGDSLHAQRRFDICPEFLPLGTFLDFMLSERMDEV